MIRNAISFLMFAGTLAAAGCAGQPTQPPVTRQVPVNESNIAEVQRAGYKVVNKDGEKLYCRSDPITGSRVRMRTQCLTEQELYDQIEQTRQSMSQIESVNPGPVPCGKPRC